MDRFLSIAEVEASASSIIGDVDDQERLYFPQWIYIAMRHIGPSKDFIKVKFGIPVENLSFPKPRDMNTMIDLSLQNQGGDELLYRYKSGTRRIHNYDRNEVRVPKVEVSEDANFFYLSTNASRVNDSEEVIGNDIDTTVIKANVRYFALPVDDDCNILIPEERLLAIMFFIRYMVFLRRNMSRIQISDARREWHQERDRVKGLAKMPSMLEGKEIATLWRSMIEKPFFDFF